VHGDGADDDGLQLIAGGDLMKPTAPPTTLALLPWAASVYAAPISPEDRPSQGRSRCLRCMRALAFVIAASGALSNSSSGADLPEQPVRVPNGFLTGSEYADEPDAVRSGYVMGMIDGLFISTLLGSSENRVHRVQDCLVGMRSGQLEAMLDKHVRDHPEHWHDGAGVLFYQVLLHTCPGIRDRDRAQQ
jgi:hypothetical protein